MRQSTFQAVQAERCKTSRQNTSNCFLPTNLCLFNRSHRSQLIFEVLCHTIGCTRLRYIMEIDKSSDREETVMLSSAKSDEVEKVPTSEQRRSSRVASFFARFSAPLPPKRHTRFIRHARISVFNVYRRLFSLVFIFNMIGLWIFCARSKDYPWTSWLEILANAAAANILVALLIRQDYIVNMLFRYVSRSMRCKIADCIIRLTWFIPLSVPLRLRRILAKVYELGGVHSGAAVSSIIWFGIFTGFLIKNSIDVSTSKWPVKNPVLVILACVLLLVLISMAGTAYPSFRFKAHNTFEYVHRWGGWLSLALFWAELVLFANTNKGTEKLGMVLIKIPAFWFLLISSVHTILPWLRLHRMKVTPEKLSDHAIQLHFTERIPLFTGIRLAKTPLGDWHSFAAIPSRGGQGGSVLVSHAGDWTRECIHNPQQWYWVKGVPVTGVLCMARIFRKVWISAPFTLTQPFSNTIQDRRRHHRLWDWTSFGSDTRC